MRNNYFIREITIDSLENQDTDFYSIGLETVYGKVTSIEEHQPLTNGDKLYFEVFTDKDMIIRIFNPSKIIFKTILVFNFIYCIIIIYEYRRFFMSDLFIKSNEEARSLNNSSPADQNVRSGDAIKTAQRLTAVKGTYDFSEKGGAISDIKLLDEDGQVVQIPAGSIVKSILSDERTVLTSGGASTLKLKAGSVPLMSAKAFDSGFTGIDLHALDGSADGILVETDTDLQLEIGSADLTAGVLDFYVEILRR